MKTKLLLLIVAISPVFGHAGSCTSFPSLLSIIKTMSSVPPEPMNDATIDKQEAMVNCGAIQILSLLSQDVISQKTAEQLIQVTARLMLYDNGESSELYADPRIEKNFRKHFFSKKDGVEVSKNVFHLALANLESSHKLPEDAKNQLFRDYNLSMP
jgi:hypothetical protein